MIFFFYQPVQINNVTFWVPAKHLKSSCHQHLVTSFAVQRNCPVMNHLLIYSIINKSAFHFFHFTDKTSVSKDARLWPAESSSSVGLVAQSVPPGWGYTPDWWGQSFLLWKAPLPVTSAKRCHENLSGSLLCRTSREKCIHVDSKWDNFWALNRIMQMHNKEGRMCSPWLWLKDRYNSKVHYEATTPI